jgi:hypothetical protein
MFPGRLLTGASVTIGELLRLVGYLIGESLDK